VPFVIGPVNGGLPWPKGFAQAERQKEWVSRLRQFYRLLPYARSTYDKASAIVTGSSETYAEFLPYQKKLFFVPENGIVENRVIDRPPRPEGPLQLIFVGRLVPFKACDLAIRAAADLLRRGLAEFTVIGDGPEKAALERLAKDLGLNVTFVGLLPHAQAMEYFRKADALVFPSIREFGGGVVFEALLSGCVPIVSNYGGPGDIVQREVGFKVAMIDEEYSVREIAKVLDRLSTDSSLLSRMSKAGQVYARDHLSWRGKAQKMGTIFDWCLGQGEKPRLEPPTR
jgi:glycosyltransferase involved in cell wall biosynthesis